MQYQKLLAILFAGLTAGMIVGCSTGPPPVEKASQAEVDQMKSFRSMYDSVGGNYNQLTDMQKKQFLDYTKGDQAAVDRMWSFMSHPLGGAAPRNNGRFRTGPNGQVLPPTGG